MHWWPWGEEALAEAQRTNRPILLSVGYAACHWCHVMAHESFESPEVAAVMNALFVNIKVDREERPDVDAIYMQALQIMGEHGGWPLTMFCTPKGEPFWGGTYFPQPARYGRPSFVDVLKGVAQAFREKPQDVETNRAGLLRGAASKAVNKAVEFAGRRPLFPLTLLDQIAGRIVQQCDPTWGGFGQAPKFPSPYVFELLWRGWLRDRGNAKLRDAVTVTLDRMCQGGIYDHLGGGFARYATDNEWLIPHFEKMLYDNAQLIDLLCLVWQETKSPLYAARIAETCDWILREMIAESGGFAATYDAEFRRRRGQVLCLGRGRDRCRARRRGRRVLPQGLRRHAPKATGSITISSIAIAPRPCWAMRRSNDSPSCAPSSRRCATSGCGRAGTTRCWPTGTA